MNTSFAENGVDSIITLDLAGSYPTGILAGLGPAYNDLQEKIMQQIAFTGNQANITTQQDAAYATANIAIEKTGLVSPDSAAAQMAATIYVNAASDVNFVNQNVSDAANVAYTNAQIVFKACSDASYSAYLTLEASQIILNRISTSVIVYSLGDSVPDVNPIDKTTLSNVSTGVSIVEQRSLDAIALSRANRLSYYNNTVTLLNNAYAKSNIIYTNLKLVAAFNTVVKYSIKAFVDPMNKISGKETLITQYVPSIPLNNAINIVNAALASVNAVSSAISINTTTSATITNTIAATVSLANSLDSAARITNNTMYLAEATAKAQIQTLKTIQENGGPISVPTIYPNNPERMAESFLSTTRFTQGVSSDADVSADNARYVSQALLELANSCSSTPVLLPMISAIAKKSQATMNSIIATIGTVTANSSAYASVKITLRATNTLLGQLSKTTLEETVSLQEASDAKGVLDSIVNAQGLLLLATDVSTTQAALWAINAAKGKAEDVSNKTKYAAHLRSRTAHDLVTPRNIATQTASANTLGRTIINRISRIDRNSRNVPVDPPPAYKSFQAGIQAKVGISLRPTLDNLVFRNSLDPQGLNSLTTILATKIKVAEEVQRTKEQSILSYKKQ